MHKVSLFLCNPLPQDHLVFALNARIHHAFKTIHSVQGGTSLGRVVHSVLAHSVQALIQIYFMYSIHHGLGTMDITSLLKIEIYHHLIWFR